MPDSCRFAICSLNSVFFPILTPAYAIRVKRVSCPFVLNSCTVGERESTLTQPHLAHGRLLASALAGLLLLHDALDFGLRFAALGRFGFGVELVCAALLGSLDLEICLSVDSSALMLECIH